MRLWSMTADMPSAESLGSARACEPSDWARVGGYDREDSLCCHAVECVLPPMQQSSARSLG